MPDYLVVTVQCVPEIAEILMAELTHQGFESFQETDSGFIGSAPYDSFDELSFQSLVEKYGSAGITWDAKPAIKENWNKKWEENYPPVRIENKILVRAPFHQADSSYEQELIIMPRMSFGTGHHETTELMLRQQLEMDFKNKIILDAGCGTGILSIMASKLGAKEIISFDIDEWSVQNAAENLKLNQANAKIFHGSIDALPKIKYHIILANINTNILLQQMSYYADHLLPEGHLVISGFLTEDVNVLIAKAGTRGLKKSETYSKNNWALVILST